MFSTVFGPSPFSRHAAMMARQSAREIVANGLEPITGYRVVPAGHRAPRGRPGPDRGRNRQRPPVLRAFAGPRVDATEFNVHVPQTDDSQMSGTAKAILVFLA